MRLPTPPAVFNPYSCSTIIIYDSYNTYDVSNNAINVIKKARIIMIVASVAFLAFGIYSLQADLFEDDYYAYILIFVGVIYILSGLVIYPFLIKKMERNMERQQYKQE